MDNLIVVGLSHRTAPVEIRERVAFPEEIIPQALKRLGQDFGVEERMIVSTCNRVEVIGLSSPQEDGIGKLKRFLAEFHDVPPSDLEAYLYAHRKNAAIHHIFRVAGSLDSMVVGEPQILSQLKHAFRLAGESQSVGDQLNTLLPRAFFVAKRVRTETCIGNSAVSISSVAVELAEKIFGDLTNKSILLLGAGEMGELATRSLLNSGACNVLVANRSPVKARILAQNFKGTFVPFEDRYKQLIGTEIVVVSTGATEYLLKPEGLSPLLRRRKYRPLFIIDISVPRNVDPRVNELDNVFLYDIDDLQSVVDSNLGERQREAEIAEGIIAEEVENFLRILSYNHSGPLIARFRDRIEQICLEELQKNRNKMDPEAYAATHRLLKRAAHKVAHPLIREIKGGDPDPDRRFHSIEIIRRAFRLDEDS